MEIVLISGVEVISGSSVTGEYVRYEDVKDDLEYLDKILDVLQDMPFDIDEILEARYD